MTDTYVIALMSALLLGGSPTTCSLSQQEHDFRTVERARRLLRMARTGRAE